MWNLVNTFNNAEKIPKFRSPEAKCFTLGCVIMFAENSFRLQQNILILLQKMKFALSCQNIVLLICNCKL